MKLNHKTNGIGIKRKNVSLNGGSLSDAELLKILIRIKNGDLSLRLPKTKDRSKAPIYTVLNDIVDQNERLHKQVEKLKIAQGKNVNDTIKQKLEERAILLSDQKKELVAKNKEIEQARKALEEKADQLALTSKYKSEFLANMSHELRTPLNSLQILARELIDNPEGNLTEKQIQFAKTINSCGEELIELINDILDLSKIESGYLSIESEHITFNDISEYIENTFKHISKSKQLTFTIEMGDDLPEFIETDFQRLNQILKNLLSNSFKFTEKGFVKLRIYRAAHNWKTPSPHLERALSVVAFEVSDSGIGIAEDKQQIVFESFQQAEGSTSRKYGGTGLGLPISRGLAALLGGIIELESELGHGSKFTLFLPSKIPKNIKASQTRIKKRKTILKSSAIDFGGPEKEQQFAKIVNDDRENILPNDKVILLIDNDAEFAREFVEKAHKNHIKIVATTKGSDVIDILDQFHPTAIIKNITPSDTKGWKVFDRLKNDLTWRHVPIYVTSSQEDKNVALKCGARNFLLKPIPDAKFKQLFADIDAFSNKTARRVLVIDTYNDWIEEVVKAIDHKDVDISVAKTAKKTSELINKKHFDCIILDMATDPDERSAVISELEKVRPAKEITLIIYSIKDISAKERASLGHFTNYTIKRDLNSTDHLVDQVAITLHRNFKDLPIEMRNRIENFSRREDILSGKKILIVDDDIRNLFALSIGLERYGLSIITCESGQEAIDILNNTTGIDIVLMDIMMPEMDGYETMKRIRSGSNHKDLTIIAVTAKAMKGDRQKCIESGASDYITKPVNVDQLVTLMRVWLKQKKS
jgi:signal transduction histidine kinase/DNA-binding response OmpR family regulator